MPYIGNTIRAADDYRLIDDISSGFNGSTTSFALQVAGSAPVPFPKSPQQVLISVNGVIQEPDPTGASGFNLVGTNIVFSSAPTNGHAFFGIIYATADYLNSGGNFPSGSLGAPSITFIGDENSGLYRKGSGSIGFVSDATEIANFDSNGITISSGNLIIPEKIIHSGDTNTFLTFPSADSFRVQIGGAQRLDFGGSTTVFNDDGGSIDFRIEGNTDEHLFFVDGSADAIGFGTSSISGGKFVFNSGTSNQVANFVSTDAGANINLTDNSARSTIEQSGTDLKIISDTDAGDADSTIKFQVDASTKMTINSSGNVGIGTASPAQLFSLSGADPRILITETTNNSQCLFDYAAGGVLEISVDDNNVDSGSKFQVRIDGATAGLTLDDTGLGIGTTAPQTVAHLAKETAKTNEVEHMLQLTHTSSGTTTTGFGTGIRFQGERNNGALQTIGDINFEADVNSGSVISAALVFKPALSGSATERMRLDSTGALGLGVTPKNNSGNYRQLQIGLGAHFYGRTDDTPIYIVSNGYRDGSDWKYTGNTTASQISLGTNITFETASSGTADNAITFNEQLRVTSSGVGIGTTSPDHNLSIIAANSATPRFGFINPDEHENINFSTYHDSNGIYSLFGANMKLDANGNNAVDISNHKAGGIQIDGRNNGGVSFLYKGSSGTTVSTAMTIASDGEVQINHAAAGQTVLSCEALYDGGSNTSVDIATFARQGGAVKSAIKYDDPSTSISFGTTTGNNFHLMTNDTTRMTINSSGNVGIGTTSPSAALHVVAGGNNLKLSRSSFDDFQFGIGTVGSINGLFISNTTDDFAAVSISEGCGANALVLASGGNVGIGTTTIGEKLTIGDGDLRFFNSDAANNHRTTFIEFTNSSNRITSESNYGSDGSSAYAAGYKFTTKNYTGSAFTTVDAFNIQANGNVGISTTSPTARLQIEGNGVAHYSLDLHNTGTGIGSQIRFRNDHDASANIGIAGGNTGDLRIYTEKTFKVNHGSDDAIKSTTNGAVELFYDGSPRLETASAGLEFHNLTAGSGNSDLRYNSSTGAVFFDTSSRLVKTDIADSPYGIDIVKQLKPRKYKRTDQETNPVELGFIADEVQSLIPEIVPTGPKSIYTKNESDTEIIPVNVDYRKFSVVLTTALQEAIAKIETLETKVAALEAA